MPDRRRLIVAGTVLVVVLAALIAGRVVWERSHRTALREAVDSVPRSTLRLAFTDWAAVRERLGVHGTGSAAVERLTEKGYDSDLTAASSIDESTAALQKHFGFSPLTVDWEAYAQGRSGAAMVVRLPDGYDFDRIAEDLAGAGFRRPSSSEGVWKGGVDLVAGLDGTLSPEVQYVVLLRDRHLVVTSDTEGYAAEAAGTASGHKPSLGDVATVRDVAAKSGEPAAAMLWSRDFVCTDLAMSQADADTQQQAEEAVTRAGKVSPMTGMAMALDADRRFTVVQLFEDPGQAKENLRARARLAVGEALGRGGSFADDLRLTTSRTQGDAVVLRFRPRARTGFVLSALDSGPLIFATC